MRLDVYSSRASDQLSRNVLTIVKVVGSAAIALWLLVQMASAQRRSHEVYAVDEKLQDGVTGTDTTAKAVRNAIITVKKRKPHITDREALLGVLMPEVMADPEVMAAQKGQEIIA